MSPGAETPPQLILTASTSSLDEHNSGFYDWFVNLTRSYLGRVIRLVWPGINAESSVGRLSGESEFPWQIDLVGSPVLSTVGRLSDESEIPWKSPLGVNVMESLDVEDMDHGGDEFWSRAPRVPGIENYLLESEDGHDITEQSYITLG